MSVVKYYMEKGRWKVTALVNPVPARQWWDAINQVKCLNHKLRIEQRTPPCK